MRTSFFISLNKEKVDITQSKKILYTINNFFKNKTFNNEWFIPKILIIESILKNREDYYSNKKLLEDITFSGIANRIKFLPFYIYRVLKDLHKELEDNTLYLKNSILRVNLFEETQHSRNRLEEEITFINLPNTHEQSFAEFLSKKINTYIEKYPMFIHIEFLIFGHIDFFEYVFSAELQYTSYFDIL